MITVPTTLIDQIIQFSESNNITHQDTLDLIKDELHMSKIRTTLMTVNKPRMVSLNSFYIKTLCDNAKKLLELDNSDTVKHYDIVEGMKIIESILSSVTDQFESSVSESDLFFVSLLSDTYEIVMLTTRNGV